jgi:outer membrane protein OmpA-like peptidoglycan-associated protein
MKGTTCTGYQRTKDSLYSILRRHSDIDPNHPDVIDTLTETDKDTPPPKQNTGQPADSSGRRPNNPLNDPLFGPEPRRAPDTSKLSHPQLTDTIIVHNIQFDFDKYLVQNPDTLQRYRSLLTKAGVKKIQVVGFTDDAGSDAYNLDLSRKRANEVARLLSSKFNIPPDIIQAEGRGISRKYPTKYLNRRVEIYIFHE